MNLNATHELICDPLHMRHRQALLRNDNSPQVRLHQLGDHVNVIKISLWRNEDVEQEQNIFMLEISHKHDLTVRALHLLEILERIGNFLDSYQFVGALIQGGTAYA